jgi:hypothetical protein
MRLLTTFKTFIALELERSLTPEQMAQILALQSSNQEMIDNLQTNYDNLYQNHSSAAIVVSIPDTSVENNLHTTYDNNGGPSLKSITPGACSERRVSMNYVKEHCSPRSDKTPTPALNMYRDFLCNVLPQGYDSSANDMSNNDNNMTANPLQLPSALKDFIDRALSTCHLEEDRKCMQEALVDLIGEKYDAGRINSHRWALQCVPNSKTQFRVAPDMASHHEYPPLIPADCNSDLFPKAQVNNKVRVEIQRQKNVAVKPRTCCPKSAHRSAESRTLAKITTKLVPPSLRSTATHEYRASRRTQHHDASAKPNTLKSRLLPLITHNRFELLAGDDNYVGGDSHTALPTTRPNATSICKPTSAPLVVSTTRPIVSSSYAPTCAPSVLPTSRPSVSPIEPQQQHPTKIKTQTNGGAVLLASEALNKSGNVPAQSTQGFELILHTDPIATILHLSKDLHHEVIYAAPAAKPPTFITGPTVPVHQLPSLAIPSSDHAEGGSTGHSDRRVLHLSSSTKTSLRNTFSGKSGENDEFSGKGD